MSRTCPDCPCPATCLRWPGFCRWAAEDPPDPIKIKHICERSKQGPSPQSVPIAVDYGLPDRPRGRCCG